MNAWKRLQSSLRGWFPKEPTFLAHQAAANPKSPIVKWTVRALVAACVVDALLLVAGDFAGLTRGVGAILYPAAVFGAVFGPVAAVPFLVKQRTNSQRRTRT